MRACPQFCGVVYAGAHRLVVFGRDGYASDFAIIAGAFEGRELHHILLLLLMLFVSFFLYIGQNLSSVCAVCIYLYAHGDATRTLSYPPK